ncbi:MAG: insulinase family protein [Geminicoccaceae bacterium]|nr:insulinase family protein [Geminicoccaceae bacterium]
MPRIETASLGVWIDVGTRHETAETNGVAHLLEHMAFKGTERRTARGIAEEIEDVGGSLNAYTSRDHTAFYARILPDSLPLAADLLGDILTASTFDAEELEKERGVVLQEIGEVEDTPSDWVFDLLQEAAYPDQPLGRPILGPEAIVEAMPRDALFAFMGAHYDPRRMIVAASGKVEHEEVVELARRHFGGLAQRATPDPAPGSYAGGSLLVARDLEQVHLCLALDAFGYEDPDLFALQVFAAALGGGMSSRLFQEAREKRGLCYSVFAFAAQHAGAGTLGVYAGTGEAEVPELLNVVAAETQALAAGANAAELARAKAQLKAGTLMALEGCFAVCEDMARQHLMYGERLSAAEIVRRIDAVDESAIARVGRRLLASARPALAAVGPQAGLPDPALIERAFGL